MAFVESGMETLHTIDTTDPDDPSVVPDPAVVDEAGAPDSGDAGELPGAHKPAAIAVGDVPAANESDGSDESEDSGDDDSGDESETDSSDGDSDSSASTSSCDDGESTPSVQLEPTNFEYPEVIDDGSTAGKVRTTQDEDLGGESVAAASAVAGVTALSAFRLRRSFILGIIVTAIGACALFYLWRKMRELKKKISQLEQQQEMGLNDRDVQFISSQVLQDYLKPEQMAAHDTRTEPPTHDTTTNNTASALDVPQHPSAKLSVHLHDMGTDTGSFEAPLEDIGTDTGGLLGTVHLPLRDTGNDTGAVEVPVLNDTRSGGVLSPIAECCAEWPMQDPIDAAASEGESNDTHDKLVSASDHQEPADDVDCKEDGDIASADGEEGPVAQKQQRRRSRREKKKD